MEPVANTSDTFDSFATRSYDAYGHRVASLDGARTGFTGEVGEADLPWYLLGDRFYVPSLQRFISPDANSPFDAGGLNRYAYCSGDPVNRIDPSGEAWWDWVIAGIGLVAAVAATVATAGALAAPIAAAAAGSLTAAVSTTTMVTLTAAVVIDVVAVVAEIGAIASLAAGDEKAAGIFGWVALGTGIASGAMAGMAKAGGKAVTKSAASAQTRSRGPGMAATSRRPGTSPFEKKISPRIKVLTDPIVIPEYRLERAGKEVKLKPYWRAHRYPDQPASAHYVSDMAIDAHAMESAIKDMAARGRTKAVVYTGVHGGIDGNNWSKNSRRAAEKSFYKMDKKTIGREFEARFGVELKFENIARVSRKTMIEKMRRAEYDHIYNFCFSAADELIMDQFNITKIVLFDP